MLELPLAALLALSTPSLASPAIDTTPADSARAADSALKAFNARLRWQHGHVTLKGGVATVDVPDGYRFLATDGARAVLENAWGNPPDKDVLGMIFADSVGPLDESSWGIVITYDEDGYVKDDDAATMNYPELLGKMQKSVAEDNPEREKQGYPSVQLLGWAETPHYDPVTHKLYWAKRLQFGDNKKQTLNYNIRALGRRGVLILNAIADMDQLESVKAAMPPVLTSANFTDGNRYADFDAKKGDKIAEYGIAALIVGGLAAKAGLFKGFLVLLLAAKKFLILAAAGAAAWFRKFFGKKKNEVTFSSGNPPPGK